MSYEQIMSQLANLMKTGSKSNAFAPLIWLCCLVLFAGMCGMFYFSDLIIKYTLLGLIVIVVVFSMTMYIVLLKKDPNLLQSENYRIEHKKLDIIATKGKDIQFNPVDFKMPYIETDKNGNSPIV